MKMVRGSASTSHHHREKGCNPKKEKVPMKARMPPVYPGCLITA